MAFAWNHQGIASAIQRGEEGVFALGINGLSLRLSKRGGSWIWQARVGGKPTKIVIGHWPTTGLAKAREIAAEMTFARDAGDVAKLESYAVKTSKAKAGAPVVVNAGAAERTSGGITTSEAWALYIEHLKTAQKPDGSPKNKPKTIYEKENFYNGLLANEIGDMALVDVKHDDLDTIVEDIRDAGKTATSNNLIAYSSAFFAWCMKAGRRKTGLTSNPCSALVKVPTAARTRVLSDDEIRWLWAVLDKEEPVWADGYRLALLLGQRKMEIFGLTVGEIDLENRLIELPRERTKNGLPHIVPFGEMAGAIIERRVAAAQGGYLFATKSEDGDPRAVSGFSRVHNRIRRAVEELALDNGVAVAEWRLHDLRRTVSTNMNSLHDENERPLIDPAHVEAVLNHITGSAKTGVAGVYNQHHYRPEKRNALRLWEERLKAILA